MSALLRNHGGSEIIIICIAHADASKKTPRRLTPDGIKQTEQALRVASDTISKLRAGEPLSSVRLVSSPACRCLETILMAGEEFGKHFAHLDRCPPKMDRVEVREELYDHGYDLLNITQGQTADLVVIALHGDLSKVSPLCDLALRTLDKDGFFDARPVIAIFRLQNGRLVPTVVEGFYQEWQNLVNADPSGG